MVDDVSQTSQVQHWLVKANLGDSDAENELVRYFSDRLERLTHKLLKGFPGVKRWEQTDDVFQNAVLRLLRAVRDVKPASPRDFFALAALQIRRELIDMSRHYYGARGRGARHASWARDDSSNAGAVDRSDDTYEPSKLAQWCEFHRQVETLPEQERETVSLLYYQGLTQAEAAAVLEVTVRTVQRRWQSALRKLHHLVKNAAPE